MIFTEGPGARRALEYFREERGGGEIARRRAREGKEKKRKKRETHKADEFIDKLDMDCQNGLVCAGRGGRSRVW